MSGFREFIQSLPLPAAYVEDGRAWPNVRLLQLIGQDASAFAAVEDPYEVLFNDRAAAFRMQHESDRHIGIDAPRQCVLAHSAGLAVPAEWSSAAAGDGEIWIFREERPAGDLPVGSYGITQDDVGDMLYWVDEDARICSVNASACEYMGYTPEDFLGMTVLDIDAVVTPEAWPAIWHALKREKRLRFESLHRKKSGEIRQVDILAQFAVVGGVEYACSTVRDITQSKEESAALAQDLAERERLLANLAGMAYRRAAEPPGVFQYASEGARALTGHGPGTFLGDLAMTFAQLVHPDDAARAFDGCARGIAARRGFTLEYRIRCKDGAVKWVQDLARPVYADDGTAAVIEGFLTDITARKHAEEALRESQILFSSFMDNSPAIAFMKDEAGRMLYVNNTFVQAVWGGNPPDWRGKDDFQLWEEPSASAFRAHDLRVFEANAPLQLDEDLYQDGQVSHYTVIKFPLTTPDGRRLLAGLGLNVTEQRKAAEVKRRMDEQLLHMQKLESLGVLAGGIAHDFNNLLTGIIGYADLASFDVPEDSAAAHSIGQIGRAARRAAELTRQMLAYSGRGKFVIQPFSLAQVLREMGGLLDLAISKRSHIVYDLQEDLPSVEGDPAQVRQVVMNLIINASEAIGDNDGVIRVSARVERCTRETFKEAYLDEGLPPGNYVMVEVADTGCGMDTETRARLFDPFFTTKFAGRGLGMAAVLGIVRSHRAAITVASQPGKGSTFRIYFPACGKPVVPEQPTPQYVNARFRGTILVADDEATVRQLAEEMLGKLGFQVLVAEDGQQALDLYHAHRDEVQTVLLDATMPHLDGPQALKALRAEGTNARIILSSGYSEANIAEQCGDCRPDAFIEKPYAMGRLVQVLSSLGQYEEKPPA